MTAIATEPADTNKNTTSPSSALAANNNSIFYIDLLRCIAAFAVIAIHILGPLRMLYGDISTSEWMAPITFNGMTRWAVPVFMMISGALLISTNKPFNCKNYMTKRLGKVVVPFIGWTIIYALFAGFILQSQMLPSSEFEFAFATAWHVIKNATNDPAWYHLWFFYDFIPLYFVIPFLAPVLKKLPTQLIYLLVICFVVLFTMHWLKVESFLRENLVLYTGYLVIGWFLFNRDNSPQLKLWVYAGVTMLILNVVGTYIVAQTTGEYGSLFMGYKTLNTMIIAGMLFVLAQEYAHLITGKAKRCVSVISKYSLGIYLLHPLLLISVRETSNGYYDMWGSYWIAIPVMTVIVMAISVVCTKVLASLPVIRRLVP